MKKFLLSLLSWTLSFSIVWIGLGLFEYYLESKSSLGTFVIGLIGFFVAVNPAMDAWEKIFEKLFKIDKK